MAVRFSESDSGSSRSGVVGPSATVGSPWRGSRSSSSASPQSSSSGLSDFVVSSVSARAASARKGSRPLVFLWAYASPLPPPSRGGRRTRRSHRSFERSKAHLRGSSPGKRLVSTFSLHIATPSAAARSRGNLYPISGPISGSLSGSFPGERRRGTIGGARVRWRARLPGVPPLSLSRAFPFANPVPSLEADGKLRTYRYRSSGRQGFPPSLQPESRRKHPESGRGFGMEQGYGEGRLERAWRRSSRLPPPGRGAALSTRRRLSAAAERSGAREARRTAARATCRAATPLPEQGA